MVISLSDLFPPFSSHNLGLSQLQHYHFIEIQSVFFKVLRERKYGVNDILNGKDIKAFKSTVIAQGTKFEYRRVKDREYLNARGPLQSPMWVGLSGSGEGEVMVRFVTQAQEDTLSSRQR